MKQTYIKLLSLKNVKDYAWGKIGSNSLIPVMKHNVDPTFKIDENHPYAEYWFGTHPSGPSKIETNEVTMLLSDWLKSHPEAAGSCASSKEGNIPFLFKVLSINKALSIQAHPDKALAIQLHKSNPKEYSDDNAKPEMACAITYLEAMCGFRDIKEIINHLTVIPELSTIITEPVKNEFIKSVKTNDKDTIKKSLRELFNSFMTASNDIVSVEINHLISRFNKDEKSLNDLDKTVLKINKEYPNDRGCLTPYLLNVVKLNQGEALYLSSNTPHAYLSGDIVEIMNCSNNVVRAGLTNKFIDVETLIKMLTYEYGNLNIMKGEKINDYESHYKTEVKEFMLEKLVIPTNKSYILSKYNTPRIVITINGRGKVHCSNQDISLIQGTLFFISAGEEVKFESNDDLLVYCARTRE